MCVQVKREVDSVLEMMRVYLARCQPQHLNCDGALKRDAYSQLIDSFSHVSVPPSWAIPAVLLGGPCLVGSVKIFFFFLFHVPIMVPPGFFLPGSTARRSLFCRHRLITS
jgi:hypothetical protein